MRASWSSAPLDGPLQKRESLPLEFPKPSRRPGKHNHPGGNRSSTINPFEASSKDSPPDLAEQSGWRRLHPQPPEKEIRHARAEAWDVIGQVDRAGDHVAFAQTCCRSMHAAVRTLAIAVYLEIVVCCHSLIGWYCRAGGGGVVRFLRCARVPTLFCAPTPTATSPQTRRKPHANASKNFRK